MHTPHQSWADIQASMQEQREANTLRAAVFNPNRRTITAAAALFGSRLQWACIAIAAACAVGVKLINMGAL